MWALHMLHSREKKKRMSLWMTSLLVLLLLVTSGCITRKYQGFQEMVEAHPKGFEDAVNGSYYRDGGSESERFVQALGRYISTLEYELERK